MEIQERNNSIVADYYDRHYEELKNFVATRVLYSAETEDLVQNIFMRLLQMDEMIVPLTLPSLIYTTARNLIQDYWRRRKKAEEYEHYIKKADTTGKLFIDGESVYSAVEIEELLEQGIAQLSKKQRTIYSLNIYDGLKTSEIALKMKTNYKSAENHLGRARKAVRNYMRQMLA